MRTATATRPLTAAARPQPPAHEMPKKAAAKRKEPKIAAKTKKKEEDDEVAKAKKETTIKVVKLLLDLEWVSPCYQQGARPTPIR